MSDLADLFPGFASEWIPTKRGRIFARIGGSGPPLMLLHGYPQTHVMWHKIAPTLAEHYTVVAADKSFRSKVLDTGQSFSFTVTKPGAIAYFCSLHPMMTGRIVVTAR